VSLCSAAEYLYQNILENFKFENIFFPLYSWILLLINCCSTILKSCSIALLPFNKSMAFIECIFRHRYWYKPKISAYQVFKEGEKIFKNKNF
jgi:hypothetical protein